MARAAAVPLSSSWLASQGKLPLAFMGLALAWLAGATVLLVVSPEVLALPHIAPPVLALAHAWILGVFVTIATGAIYQLAPVALSTTLWSDRLGWAHFGLQAISVPVMVYSFFNFDMRLLGFAGTVFAIGILFFALNTAKTVLRSTQRDVVALSLLLAAGWLAITVLAGLLLAANRRADFLGVDPLALLRAHAHLGLIGFFLSLLQGVTFRLVPMFTLGDVRDWKPVRLGLALTQVGVLALVPALAWKNGYTATAAGGLVLAGLVASGWALKQTLATRRKRQLDPGIRSFVRGMGVLAVTAVIGLLLAWPTSPWGSMPGGLSAMVYGVLVVFGGLLPAIGGMLCKIIPFLTWMRAYGPKVGRVPTPAASAMTRPTLESWALNLQLLAVVPLVAGVWTGDIICLRGGAGMLAVGVALFLADMIGVLRHLVWTNVGNSKPIFSNSNSS